MIKLKRSHRRQITFTPAGDLLPASWKVVRKNFITVLELVLVPALVSTLAYLLFRTPAEIANMQAAAHNPSLPVTIGPGVTASGLGTLIASIAIGPPLVYALLQSVRGKPVDVWPAIKGSTRFYLRYIGLLLVISVAFLIGACLIIPAFFVLQRFILAPYYLIDRDLSIKQALLTSAREASQSGWAIWQMLLIIAMILTASYVPSIGTLLSLVFGIAFTAAPAIRYKELTDAKLS